MSGNEPPELRAYRELETLVRHLGEELAVFRRRALAAEAQLGDPRTRARGEGVRDHGRGRDSLSANAADLETENRALRAQVARAEERVRQLMDRVRFLRQQVQIQAPGVSPTRQTA